MFKSNSFVSHTREHIQILNYCGINAHHKNGAAGRAIRTFSECTHVPSYSSTLGVTIKLCSASVEFDMYLYNHLPNEKNTSPADLFTGATSPRYELKDGYVW